MLKRTAWITGLVMGFGAFHFEVMGSNSAQFRNGQKLIASKGLL